MLVHVLYAWTLYTMLTSLGVHGKYLKTFDDGVRDCQSKGKRLYPVDRLDTLINMSIKSPNLTWINEVQITDTENGFSINVTGRVDIPKCLPAICWNLASSEIKIYNKSLMWHLGPHCGYDGECNTTKTITSSELISLVQQNFINETEEYVVFNFSNDHPNRQCVYLSTRKLRVPVNCSLELPALCYGSSFPSQGVLISFIIGTVFGGLIAGIVVFVYMKRRRRGKPDKNYAYLTTATNQNTTDDTHRYAVPSEHGYTRESETDAKAYTDDYLSVI